MGEGTSFSDLTDEDKAKVVGGCVAAVVFLIGVWVFLSHDVLQALVPGRSGTIFSAVPLVLLDIFAFCLAPMIVAFFAAASFFVKYSKIYWAKTFFLVLGSVGAVFLFVAFLMALLNILLANAPEEIQAISMVVAIFGSGIIMGRLFLSKKIGRKLGFIKENDEPNQHAYS